jgi:hypothetical protein
VADIVDGRTGEVFEDTGRQLATFGDEVSVMVTTARRFPRPRDKDIATKILERATLNSSIAEECLYTISRGNKAITGPSIRFAEIIRSCVKNIYVKAFIISDGSDHNARSVKVGAMAYDCEDNAIESVEVVRGIMTSAKGGEVQRKYTSDLINQTIMAAQAIARRNAIIALVPKALWIDALDQVERVVAGDESTLNQKRAKILEDFKKMKVDPEDLFEALGIEDSSEIGLNDLPQLRGMWTALKDGEAVESVLGQATKKQKPAAVNPLANDLPKAEPSKPAEKPQEKPAEKKPASRGRQPKPAEQPKAAESGQPKPVEVTGDHKDADQVPIDPRNEDPDPEPATGDQGISVDDEKSEREAEAANELAEAMASQGQPQTNGKAPDDPMSIPPELQRKKVLSPYAEALQFVGEFKGEPGDLLNWWRSKEMQAARSKMSFEEQGHLNKVYSGKFIDLNK